MLRHPYDKMSDEEITNKYETVGDFPRKASVMQPDYEYDRHYKSYHAWTLIDDSVLIRLHKAMSLHDLARTLFRTEAAVYEQMRKLRLIKPNK